MRKGEGEDFPYNGNIANMHACKRGRERESKEIRKQIETWDVELS